MTTVLASANGGRAGAVEANYFLVFNQLPEWVGPCLRFFAAAGNPLLAVLAAGAALVAARPRLGVAILLAAVVAAGSGALLGALVVRESPTAVIEWEVQTRSGVDADAGGLVAASVLLAAALATAVTPHLREGWRWPSVVTVLGAAAAPLWSGSHLPLDVVASAAAGVAVGSLTNVLLVSRCAASVARDV